MLTRPLIIAALAAPLILAPAAPAAAATYDLRLDGQVQYFPLCNRGTSDCDGWQPIWYDWRGRVQLSFDPPSDPAADPSPVAISLWANGGSFSYPKESGFVLSSDVTITDGRVTGIDAIFPSPYSDDDPIAFTGLYVQLVDPGSAYRGMAVYTGSLTAVPEPAAPVSMLGGLLAMAGLAFLRRRRPAS